MDEGNHGNRVPRGLAMNWIKKRPAATGLFFGFGNDRSATGMFTVPVS